MTRTPSRAWPLAVALTVVLAACTGGGQATPGTSPGTSPGGTSPTGSPAASPAGLSAVYVSTGPIGVNPFLQLIAEGIQDGGAECGVETRVVESADLASFEDNLQATVEEGHDLIVTNSFDSVDAVTRLSAEHPDQQWAIVDIGIEDNPNVRGLVFKEHEGTYLLGAIFGLLATGDYEGYPQSDVIGAVGAVDLPFIRRWYVGFEEGVRAVNPEVDVVLGWGTGFNDPATSKELALAQHEQGAEYIFAFAAAGNSGVFEAAQQEGFFTSGIDTDQRSLDPDHIVESMVKRTDLGVRDAVCDVAAGEFGGGFAAYGLAEGGVGPAFLVLENPDPPSDLPEEVQDQVRELADQIVSGEITVTDYLTEQ